ncbi:hypothetical protein SGM_6223 [Streptomyces griseoaurantiacus M045]|uniref:Uncharacterized protein n=1 Tax=Streptomyces griseoaurantiacus M045 TaxID=996637 RepID=F3NSV9_9ACTN|nr:hypothetical protein SGM_6223 [Streptomyces griseoaurantiacus M045]
MGQGDDHQDPPAARVCLRRFAHSGGAHGVQNITNADMSHLRWWGARAARQGVVSGVGQHEGRDRRG